MKKIEIILWLTALIAGALNLFNYPMSTPLLIVAIGNLSFFYMYLSIPLLNQIPFRKMFSRSSYNAISKLRIIGTLALGLSFSASLIGVLFKLMIWPNAQLQMLIGLLGVCIALGVAVWKFTQNKDSFYIEAFKRIALILVVLAIGLALPKFAILEFKYSDYPDYVEAFKQRVTDPNSVDKADKLELERQNMLESLHEPPTQTTD